MSLCDLLQSVFGKSGIERPSPSDIIPKENIQVKNFYNVAQVVIDYMQTNIPFTHPPNILGIMDIPDTNSMDGLMDYGNNPLYIEPADAENQQLMVDWLAKEFLLGEQTGWKQGGANDCVYRVPADWSVPAQIYAIHRIWKIGSDAQGRWWKFKGINNSVWDGILARDSEIFWLNTGVIF